MPPPAPTTIASLPLLDSDEEDLDFIPTTKPKRPRSEKRKRRESESSESSSSSCEGGGEEVREEGKILDEEKKKEIWEGLMEEDERARRERDERRLDLLGKEEGEEMVEISRPRRFAGETIYEKIKLPISHPDVALYRHLPPPPIPSNSPIPTPSTSSFLTSTSLPAMGTPVTTAPMGKPKPKPPLRKKPRQSLEAMNAAVEAEKKGAKKMGTFEKSKLDWQSHSSSLSEMQKAELEANRQKGGGGWLEKQELLSRLGGGR